MIVCLLHKEKCTSSEVGHLLKAASCSVNELSMQDNSFEESLVRSCADVIIINGTESMGDIHDASILTKLRTVTKVPVLLVTHGRELASYRQIMLDAGVDSCIQVPFLQEELILRIKKLISKKDGLLFSGTSIVSRSMVLDMRTHTVEVEGKDVALTKTEYSILLHLFLHQNVIVSPKELLRCLGGNPGDDSLALYTHIFNLRKKIKDAGYIRTVPLYGFMLSSSLLCEGVS